MKRILVTGGAGYVGNVLVPRLLELDYEVLVYDILFFGKDTLPLNNKNLKVVQGDIRDTKKLKKNLMNIDAVIHLACISNDPSFLLDEELSRSINYDCFEPMVLASKEAGVKRFIYCSSSSVYGVSELPEVREDTPLVPLTLYNKYKGLCEPLLLKHCDENFTGVIVRPATICGYSPRMRLDLSVNILTNQAVNLGEINVFGGNQQRPNLHIQDMCDLYILLLKEDKEKIQKEIFNVGHQNLSMMEIAEKVKLAVERLTEKNQSIQIKITTSEDNRSYRINSDKIYKKLGFLPKREISDAVEELFIKFKNGALPNSFDDDCYYNVRQLKKKGA
ncbi:MAG: NAD-dependent epimerase/dehydratase family protein, partial [Gammaproteobacteria bacterium]